MVFRMLVRLTGSRENVDDLAQDVFLRLYRALPSFRGEALLSTYLHRIVVNVAQDEWKRRKRIDQRQTSISDETSGWEIGCIIRRQTLNRSWQRENCNCVSKKR